MRKLSVLVVALLALSGVSVPPAQASPISGGSGYVYHMGSANNGKLMRYNIVEDIDEEISIDDPSCAGMRINYPNDIEFDATNQYFYWSADNWQAPFTWIARMNLRTGICQLVAEGSALNSNGLKPLWRGMDIDESRGKLFFADNQGNSEPSEPNNYSLGVIDLTAIPDTGAVPPNAKQMIQITMAAGEPTELNYANEVLLEGDYAYIGGKNTDQNQVGGSNEQGVGIYKARIFDNQGSVMNAIEASKVYSLVDPAEGNPHIIKMELHNGFLYYSTFSWKVGGIHKVDLSTYTAGNPITTHEVLVSNTNTYDFSYGFTFGFNDKIFASDRPVWPGPFYLVHLDGSAAASTVTGGTTIESAYSDTNVYGQMAYRTDIGPATPVLSSPVRTDDTTGSFSFSVANTAPARELFYIAKGSDNSTLTGTCTASPCSLTGLTAGITYSVSMRQRWLNGSTEIMRSLASSEITLPVPTVQPPTPPVKKTYSKAFGGFATMKAVLTGTQKAALRQWTLAHGSATTVSCVGYVGNNWKGVTATALKQLGLARAKAACAYVKSVKPGVKIGKVSAVITSSKNSAIRRVLVTVK